MKKSRPLMAIISTVILGAPVVHAQTAANFQAPSTSIFTVVPTPNGHPKLYQNDLHSVCSKRGNRDCPLLVKMKPAAQPPLGYYHGLSQRHLGLR